MNYSFQQLDLKRTAIRRRHSFANINGNGGIRLLNKHDQLVTIAFSQRSLLTKNNGEPMF